MAGAYVCLEAKGSFQRLAPGFQQFERLETKTMPRPKRSIQSEIKIDGFSLVWNLQREQQWCGEDRLKGAAIHVQVAGAARRELLLEYPPIRTQKDDGSRIDVRPQKIAEKKVESHIREAMAAGWDPNSRGKPFVYQVAELPS